LSSDDLADFRDLSGTASGLSLSGLEAAVRKCRLCSASDASERLAVSRKIIAAKSNSRRQKKR
jgi:hypothetical protein